MNENIGAKGGKQDRKRCLTIKKKKLEKLKNQQELEEKLRKDIKRNDIKTFFKIIPIVIIGESCKILFSKEKSKNIKKENTTNQIKKGTTAPQSNQKSNQLKNNEELEEQNINAILTPFSKKTTLSTNNTSSKEQVKRNAVTKDNIEILEQEKQKEELQEKEKQEEQQQKREREKEKENEERKEKKQKETKTTPPTLPSPQITNNHNKNSNTTNNKHKKTSLPNKEENTDNKKLEKQPIKKLHQITNIKLLEEYEKRLQDTRYSLRKLIYEYNNLVKESEDIYTKKDAEAILDKLNLVIRKLEELKEKIKIEDIEKYDDAYIYYLVNEYMQEFDDKKFIKEIKDSDLYVIISEKIQELDKKRENLEQKIEERKEKVTEDEENLENAKKDYNLFANFDKDLTKFQDEQLQLIKDLEIQMQNAVSVSEKVQIEAVGMNNQARRLLQLMALQMMIPGTRSATNIIVSTMLYMHFMRQMIHPEFKTKKYKVINVEDFSRNIRDSLYKIDDVTDKLKTTSKKLNDMIKDFETTYEEYFDALPECRDLLNNLKKIQDNLNEKEYEIEKIKQEQLKNLENNNARVKKLDNKVEVNQ